MLEGQLRTIGSLGITADIGSGGRVVKDTSTAGREKVGGRAVAIAALSAISPRFSAFSVRKLENSAHVRAFVSEL